MDDGFVFNTKIEQLPVGSGKEGDYRSYYFKVTEKDPYFQDNFVITFSETVVNIWRLDDARLLSFANILLRYLRLVDPDSRKYFVTSYEWFYKDRYEISFDLIKDKIVQIREESSERRYKKLLDSYYEKVNRYFNELEIFDDKVNFYRRDLGPEKSEMYLFIKNKLTNLAFLSNSDMTQFLISLVSTYELWDTIYFANYIPDPKTAKHISAAKNLLKKALPERDVLELNNLKKIAFLYKGNQKVVDAVVTLKNISVLRHNSAHLKARDYMKCRKILQLRVASPRDAVESLEEVIVLLGYSIHAIHVLSEEVISTYKKVSK